MNNLAKPPKVLDTPGLTFDGSAIKKAHDDSRQALAVLSVFKVTNAEELVEADDYLSQVVRERDALVAKRQELVKPFKTLVSTVEETFRPFVKDLTSAEEHLKKEIGAYRLAQQREAEAAREAAAVALETTGKVDVQAIERANALTEPDAGRSTTRYVWEVKRINPDLLPDEYWAPDRAKIEAIAKAAKGDDAPVVPGVVFERVAIVGARR